MIATQVYVDDSDQMRAVPAAIRRGRSLRCNQPRLQHVLDRTCMRIMT